MTRSLSNIKIIPVAVLTFCLSIYCEISSAQRSIIEQVQMSEDSIVTIQAQKLAVEQNTQEPQGLTTQQGSAVMEQTGAGIIIDAAGYIVTNTHIIMNAQFIFVTLRNGTRLPAAVAAIAPDSDFSILKIEPPSTLKALNWADSDSIKLGDKIISVGNSPLLKETISGGTVKGIGQKQSGPGNTVDLIETDLNLFNGDSGGPILDHKGNFLGIIVAKNTRVERSSFAIPSNQIREHFLKYLNGASNP